MTRGSQNQMKQLRKISKVRHLRVFQGEHLGEMDFLIEKGIPKQRINKI